MENFLKKSVLVMIAAVFVIFGFSNAFSAISDSASVGTTVIIIKPLTITGTQALHFGKIHQPAASGTATVTPTGGHSGVGVTWYDDSLIQQAVFTVSGEAGAEISVTLPSTYDVTSSGGGDPMGVASFTSDAAANKITLNGSGEGTIQVGATLSIGADQEAGTYTNSSGLEVTVSY